MTSYESQELVEINYFNSQVFLNVGFLDFSRRDEYKKKFNLI